MRSKEEIDYMLGMLSNSDLMSQREDTFKYGFIMGKLTALGWIAGDPTADMKNDYDFESWMQELHAAGGPIPPSPPQ